MVSEKPGCCVADSECATTAPCTAAACVDGACVVSEKPGCCVADSECPATAPCTQGKCVDSACALVTLPNCCTNDAQCETGEPCQAASCIDGVCVVAPDPECECVFDADCATDDPCMVGSCLGGACLFELVDCGPGDACHLSVCTGGASPCVVLPIPVDDGNPCTTDLCDPETGPYFVPLVCEDDNACTLDACSLLTGGCVFTPVPASDGNACTDDLCDPETGVVHVPIVCDDGSTCTYDGCKPDTGCYYTPIDVSDGDPCTTDSCDPETGASHVAIDCDDGSPCTEDTCGAGGCEHVPTAGCCAADADCDDGQACTADLCKGGICEHPVTCCNETGEVEQAAFAFELGVPDGVTASAAPVYRWREQGDEKVAGNASLYFGDPFGDHYCQPPWANIGPAPSGTATMPDGTGVPSLTLPAGVPSWVSFHARLDMRSDPSVDKLTLRVLSGGTSVPIWDKTAIPATDYGVWTPVTVDLSAFAGQTIQLRFSFDVVNKGGCYNSGAGPRIDELSVTSAACAIPCVQDSDCNDGDECTADTCADGQCSNIAGEAPLVTLGFEEDPAGWSTESTAPYRWRTTSSQAASGTHSLYFGNGGGDGYCTVLNFQVPSGTAALPLSPVAFDSSAVLTFWTRLSIRSNAEVDVFTVSLVPSGGEPVQIWSKTAIAPSLYGQWVPVTVDLTPFAPFEGTLRLDFDVKNKLGGSTCAAGDGVFVDNVAVIKPTCAP